MLIEAPKPTAEQLAEIERLETEAKRSRVLAEESFQRSDTDGFLSQWAHNITADKNRNQIEILRNGGYAEFPVLVDADDNVVADKIYSFPNKFRGYGNVERWRLPDDLAAKVGRRWIPTAGYSGKSRIQKQLGLHESTRWFPAEAKICGNGTGLSGCANAYVAAVRV